jgi:hypothetical protein
VQPVHGSKSRERKRARPISRPSPCFRPIGFTKQARTAEIYAHLADDPVRQLADRTGSRIADAMKVGADREKPKGEVVQLSTARAGKIARRAAGRREFRWMPSAV